MNIQLEFAVAPDDYVEFQRAYVKHRKSLTPRSQRGLRLQMFAIWGAVVGVIVLFYATDYVVTLLVPPPVVPPAPPGPPPTAAQDFAALIPFVVMFLYLWGFFMWLRGSKFLHRRLASQGTKIGEIRKVDITDDDIVIREPACVTTAQWTHFIRFVETKSLFLLFIIPRHAHIIPKRGFPSPEAVNEFRAFAQAHVGNSPVGFPVQLVGTMPVALPSASEGPGNIK